MLHVFIMLAAVLCLPYLGHCLNEENIVKWEEGHFLACVEVVLNFSIFAFVCKWCGNISLVMGEKNGLETPIYGYDMP